jgi:bifunctional UDP-N-acetylglucosamine pyrophosphorylase/glucosamine-1-phosphate N-acetyltransferase
MLCKYELLFSFINKISNKNRKREKYLPDIFAICYLNKKSFQYIQCKEEEMLGINTLDDFNKIDEIYQNLLKKNLIEKGVNIINPKTVRISYDTQVGNHSTIESFVFIKNGVKIKNQVIVKSHSVIESSIIGKGSSIGPFARLRPGSVIGENVKIGNFVEIKNSKIGNKSTIAHLSYIGDSQLGKNINIGAGTITCNYDGKKKSKTIIEDKVFIGSNTSLVAPLKIGRNSKTGAGSIITRNIPSNSLVVGHDKLVFANKTRKK